jgi:hypothetical protein
MLNIKKTKALLNTISNTFNIEVECIQYILEKELSKLYDSIFPGIILMSGKFLVVKENGLKAVLPGAKTLEKALKNIEKDLIETSIKKKQEALKDKEPIGYGKVLKKLKNGKFEIMLFEGTENGKAINSKIIKGFFDAKKNGIEKEDYIIGKHYVFKKIKMEKNTFYLTRKDVGVIKFELLKIINKIESTLGKKIYIKILKVNIKNKTVYTEHTKGAEHFIKSISNKLNEKTTFKMISKLKKFMN